MLIFFSPLGKSDSLKKKVPSIVQPGSQHRALPNNFCFVFSDNLIRMRTRHSLQERIVGKVGCCSLVVRIPSYTPLIFNLPFGHKSSPQ